MDVAALRECTLSALDTNADIRRQAELQLKQVPEILQTFVFAQWGPAHLANKIVCRLKQLRDLSVPF